jgi:Xaa-Pro aminopeptidase
MPNLMDHAGRRARAAARCLDSGIAALLLAPGSDLTYLSGYRIFSSERLTCLVLGDDGTATLVVPELEAPRAAAAAPDLRQMTWSETSDPYALVASLVTRPGAIAVSDLARFGSRERGHINTQHEPCQRVCRSPRRRQKPFACHRLEQHDAGRRHVRCP